MKLTKKLGMILLGIWLIATGIIALAHPDIPYSGTIMAILAIAAGLLILLGK